MTFNRRSLFRMLAAAAAAPAAIARAAYGGIVERVPLPPAHRVVVQIASPKGDFVLLVPDAREGLPFFIADGDYVIKSAYVYPSSEGAEVAATVHLSHKHDLMTPGSNPVPLISEPCRGYTQLIPPAGSTISLSPGDRLSVSFQ